MRSPPSVISTSLRKSKKFQIFVKRRVEDGSERNKSTLNDHLTDSPKSSSTEGTMSASKPLVGVAMQSKLHEVIATRGQ